MPREVRPEDPVKIRAPLHKPRPPEVEMKWTATFQKASLPLTKLKSCLNFLMPGLPYPTVQTRSPATLGRSSPESAPQSSTAGPPHSNCHSCPPRPCPGLLCTRTHHARHSFPLPLHLHTWVWSPGLPYPCRPAASKFTRPRQTLLRSPSLAIQLPAPHLHITYACQQTPWASAHSGQKPSLGAAMTSTWAPPPLLHLWEFPGSSTKNHKVGSLRQQ